MKTVPTNIIKFKSRGRIRYSPTNNGKSIRRDGGTTKWWIIIDCDPGIGHYYRDLYQMANYGVHKLQRPTWDAHISIVSNEKPSNMSFWKKYEGVYVDFEYVPIAESNKLYVWLPVVCEKALDIRSELGLKRNPYYPLHLTFGNRKEQ